MENIIEIKSNVPHYRQFLIADFNVERKEESYVLAKLNDRGIKWFSNGTFAKDGEALQVTFVSVNKKDVDALFEILKKMSGDAFLLGIKDYEKSAERILESFKSANLEE